MKSLLGKLIGKNTKTHAADLSWLDDLAKLDDITAIENSTQKLKDCFANDSINAADRLRMLLATDTENRQRVLKITRQFVDFENMRPELETHTADTMYFYHRQIFIGYRSFVDCFLDANGDILFTYNRLPVILGRALQAAYAMTRWRYYRQQSAADTTWSEIFGLYRILEQESLLDLTVPLYHDEPDIHLAASFVQACMLDSLGSSSLSKEQVERTTLLLEKLIPWSNISKHYNENRHLFYVDLSADRGAKRIRMLDAHPDFRYWDTDQLSARIDADIQALDRDLPHDLEKIGSNSELLEIFTLLRSEWSRNGYKRQRRSEERRKVIKRVIVSYGFQDVCDQLKNISHSLYKAPLKQSETSLDDRLMNHNSVRTAPSIVYEDLTRQRWMISDESNSGYGVIFSDELPTEIKLGKLLGLVVEDQPKRLIIGHVKSINKAAKADNHLGIKIISREANWAQLSHASLKTENSENANGLSNQILKFAAIYLPVEPGLLNWPSLILPRIEYVEHGIYQLFQQNHASMVQLGAPIETKDDWIEVRINNPERKSDQRAMASSPVTDSATVEY